MSVRTSVLAVLVLGLGLGCDPTYCSNECRFARDGECDDGRPGAVSGLCELGTDCSDCGPNPNLEPVPMRDGAVGRDAGPVPASCNWEVPADLCGRMMPLAGGDMAIFERDPTIPSTFVVHRIPCAGGPPQSTSIPSFRDSYQRPLANGDHYFSRELAGSGGAFVSPSLTVTAEPVVSSLGTRWMVADNGHLFGWQACDIGGVSGQRFVEVGRDGAMLTQAECIDTAYGSFIAPLASGMVASDTSGDLVCWESSGVAAGRTGGVTNPVSGALPLPAGFTQSLIIPSRDGLFVTRYVNGDTGQGFLVGASCDGVVHFTLPYSTSSSLRPTAAVAFDGDWAADGDLFVLAESNASPVVVDGQTSEVFIARLDPEGGARRWARHLAADVRHFVRGANDTLWVCDNVGGVRVLDPDDGSVLLGAPL